MALSVCMSALSIPKGMEWVSVLCADMKTAIAIPSWQPRQLTRWTDRATERQTDTVKNRHADKLTDMDYAMAQFVVTLLIGRAARHPDCSRTCMTAIMSFCNICQCCKQAV